MVADQRSGFCIRIRCPHPQKVSLVLGRKAFTLLELLLVLAVLAAIASAALPNWGLLLDDRRLVRAGDQLRNEMARLRVEAMREGRVMMLEGMVDGSTLRFKPFYSVSDSTETTDQTGSQAGLLTGATQAVAVTVDAEPAEEELIELPEGIVVTGVGVVSAARSAEIEQLTLSDQGEGWSRPILFYPDGSCSTALVSLAHPTVGRIMVKIRGITGEATVSEVLAR